MGATKPKVLLCCCVGTLCCAGARWDPSALPVSLWHRALKAGWDRRLRPPSCSLRPAGWPWGGREVAAGRCVALEARVRLWSCAGTSPTRWDLSPFIAPAVWGQRLAPTWGRAGLCVAVPCPTAGSSPRGHLPRGAGTTALRAEVPVDLQWTGLRPTAWWGALRPRALAAPLVPRGGCSSAGSAWPGCVCRFRVRGAAW